MDKKGIGLKLRELRGKRPRRKVASDLGVALSTLRMWENGERVPRDNTKIAIANYYNTSVKELFFDLQ